MGIPGCRAMGSAPLASLGTGGMRRSEPGALALRCASRLVLLLPGCQLSRTGTSPLLADGHPRRDLWDPLCAGFGVLCTCRRGVCCWGCPAVPCCCCSSSAPLLLALANGTSSSAMSSACSEFSFPRVFERRIHVFVREGETKVTPREQLIKVKQWEEQRPAEALALGRAPWGECDAAFVGAGVGRPPVGGLCREPPSHRPVQGIAGGPQCVLGLLFVCFVRVCVCTMHISPTVIRKKKKSIS